MRYALAPILALIGVSAAAQPPAGADPWKFDELFLRNGSKFDGLVLEETAATVRFRSVSRRPGRPTFIITTTFQRVEVDSIRKLADADRRRLTDRLAELDPSGKGERARMEALDLEPADWIGKPGAGRKYESDYFTLVTGAADEVARRAAVRLEMLTAALRRYIPPRVQSSKPTLVLLAPDLIQYRAIVGKALGPVLNPALFDPNTNRIVCGSDLDRLGTELTGTLLHHQRQLADIDKYEAEVKKLYKGQKGELDRYLEAARTQRQKVEAADRVNNEAFDKATGQLFAVLYHEAFHAYVGTFVHPPAARADVAAGTATGELPRWLNEGLAQLFETAILEAGELRVDHHDADRLGRVNTLLKPGGVGLVPLPELLRTNADSFLAVHAGQKTSTDRAYLTAWAVSAHLLLEKRAVRGDGFAAYLMAVNTGGDPVKAFEAWVGKDVIAYEKELVESIGKIKPNGLVR